ncbi:MAG: glycoside hydrolase family 3 C-terminal domain-containing protein [Dysgonamonadaceae bacterium]|nr:glycoside hydrolase family 3 C-terminal domain-containing protein [Dysgonamonadaceae bacterium]
MLLFVSFAVAQTQIPVYQDLNAPIEKRVEDALSRMTLEEKAAVCHAQSKFSSPGVPRLGIPENWMTDGPHGIRAEVFWDEWDQAGWTNDSCFAFPALTCLAATWNPSMAAVYGKAIGEEARYRNKNVLLGPGVNIYRVPLNGRNFEYMGEDPYLASQMVVPYIQEVQKNHVAACVKHYALNNQEIDRGHINVIVSDRALHEIYLPAFKAAVQKGGAWAIMGAYNQYKGQHCCHNEFLLNDILKRDWKFDGVVISDWGGVHNTRQSARNGLDMEFGSWTNGLTWSASNAYDNYYLAVPYLTALKNGEESEKDLNDKVRRILRLIFRTNMAKERSFGAFNSEAHSRAGLQIAQEGIVLLQNKNNTLPINTAQTKKIAVIGENAIKMMTVGGGSSSLKAKYEISPLKGIQDKAGNTIEIVYERGYVGEASATQDGLTVADIHDSRSPEQLFSDALSAAKSADYVIFIGGLNKHDYQDSEGNDRKSLSLPYNQDKLIIELSKMNPKTIVVILSGNAVAMPWVNSVPSIVEAWYNGSEAGTALASVLFGDVNPSGKLPFTFPAKLEDNSAIAVGEYPGDGKNVSYKDDIFVGYRWHDTKKLKPLFAFGHGLSYTQFAYGKISIDKTTVKQGESLTVSIPVKNVGQRSGSEIVQLYIRDEKSSLPRPEKELKGFFKINLQAGEEKTVTFTIEPEALQFYDDRQAQWISEPGKFEVLVGASSVDIRQRIGFSLQ